MSSQTGQSGWTVFVLPSSHNDIGWAGTPSEIAEHRADTIVDSVLTLMEEDPDFAFTIEAGLYLREYRERRPERLPLITRYMKEGRLEIGGSYIQPYEGLLSGESLIRQLTWGRGWTEQTFDVAPEGYWNIDVAGRTRQMPQVLAKSGLRYMVLSRNQPGLYWWQAPDGSKVLVLSFMEGSYGHSPIMKPLTAHFSPLETSGAAVVPPQVAPQSIATTLVPLLETWAPFFDRYQLRRYFLIIAAADYSVPDKRLRQFIDRWNAEAQSGDLQLPFPVSLRFGNAAQYFAALEEDGDLSSLETITGELPNPWIYIHGACHHKTIDAMRASAHYLSAAEIFGSALESGEFAAPQSDLQRELEPAWLDHLYPDHGYGGLHGEGTDEVFRQKEESALHRARLIARQKMRAIARSVSPPANSIRQLTIFNPLSWDRTDWVETEIVLSPAEGVKSVALVDHHGDPRTFQPLETSYTPDGVLQRIRLGFIADDVPSMGYITYHLVPGTAQLETSPTRLNSLVPQEFEWDGPLARIRLSKGGVVEYFDKSQRRNLISPDFYLGFEVIELGSPGHDVGEGERDITVYDWTANRPFQPTTHGLERTSDRGSELRILEDGPVRTRVMTQSAFSHCRVIQTFTLYRELDRLDVAIDIERWSGTHGRELRMMVPFGAPEAEMSYDVPFAHVVVGRDEAHDFAPLRPREVQSWMHARSKAVRFTLSSSVVTHDWRDPANSTERPVLQSILLATKRSCHPKGPWYTQEGNHVFSASLSGAPDSVTERTRFGWGARRPMDVLVTERTPDSTTATEPASQRFLSVEPASVMISALKPADDDNAIVVRCWELEGNDTSATLHLNWPVERVWECDLLEHEQNLMDIGTAPAQSLTVDVPAHGIVTLKAVLSAQSGPGT